MTRTQVRPPRPQEVKQAVVARDELRALAEEVDLFAADSYSDEPATMQGVELPRLALSLLIDVLSELASGRAVRLVPVEEELTTQEAADLLNVSRPYLIQILEEGQLPYRHVGNRRRVRADDVLAYKRRDDARRREVLDALAAEGRELGIDY